VKFVKESLGKKDDRGTDPSLSDSKRRGKIGLREE